MGPSLSGSWPRPSVRDLQTCGHFSPLVSGRPISGGWFCPFSHDPFWSLARPHLFQYPGPALPTFDIWPRPSFFQPPSPALPQSSDPTHPFQPSPAHPASIFWLGPCPVSHLLPVPLPCDLACVLVCRRNTARPCGASSWPSAGWSN